MFAIVGVVATVGLIGFIGYQSYKFFFEREETESVPSMSYLHDAEYLEEDQAGVKYLIEDEDGVDVSETLDAVVEWAKQTPEIFNDDYKVTVTTFADLGLIEISGDASPLIAESYDDVEVPYVDGNDDLQWVKIDLEFA